MNEIKDYIENSGIIEDEIVSIEEYKSMDTIDIELDSDNKLFFANDILTHNSGWDSSDVITSDVAESAALIHTIDGLFGIITNPSMKANGEYYLKYLADRVSGMENKRKKFNVNWQYGRIEEDKNKQIEDMNITFGNLANERSYKENSSGTQVDIEKTVGAKHNTNSANDETTIEDIANDKNNKELFK